MSRNGRFVRLLGLRRRERASVVVGEPRKARKPRARARKYTEGVWGFLWWWSRFGVVRWLVVGEPRKARKPRARTRKPPKGVWGFLWWWSRFGVVRWLWGEPRKARKPLARTQNPPKGCSVSFCGGARWFGVVRWLGGTTEGATHLPSFFRLMAGRCGVGYAGACGTLDYGVFPPECVAGGVFFI